MAEPEGILAVVREIFAELAVGEPGAASVGSPTVAPAAMPAAAPARDSTTAEAPAASPPWSGRRVVVTAGPTHEPIDPVRFLANRSSGVFGHAIAAAAVRAGARVTLITGPTAVLPPRGLEGLERVETAREMADAVAAALGAGADWLIMNAAVADFAPAQPATTKIKKDAQGETWRLDLVRTPDILGEVVPQNRQPETRVVGFALETEDLVARALAKLTAKGLDFVVANDPTGSDGSFGAGLHRVRLLGPAGEIWASDALTKDRLAAELLARLAAAAAERPA
jgi:phosphopantothenoylcysteine decarboxylase/phosphopantothenate--cysteine ligase